MRTLQGKSDIEISVIAPFLNEGGSVKELYREIIGALNQLNKSYEIIFVDDGSTDNTYDDMKELASDNPDLKIIGFRKNFGQTAAIYAGFLHASGTIIILLDGDLQNDPADIKRLISKLNEGYDIVSGWRRDRKDNLLTRRIPSIIANKLISLITHLRLHDYGCTLKAYRSEILSNIKLYGEMHRFIPAIANWQGARIAEIEVTHRPRTRGKTKYGIERIFKVLLDLVTIKFFGSFLAKPIYIFGSIGMLLTVGAFAAVTMVIIRKIFFGFYIIQSPLTLLAILLLILGVMFILLGILAEIMVRLYYSSEKQPPFYIKEKINL